MEGNSSSGVNMAPVFRSHPYNKEIFNSMEGNGLEQGHHLSFIDFSRCNSKRKGLTSDDDHIDESGEIQNEADKGKEGSHWHRVKWTDKMVMLLVTAVSYMGEDACVDTMCFDRRRSSVSQKKGKWKTISKVMAERGFYLSPQQCEDKFNDLNKRYKRLNDVLGRGTSCDVVENPELLDMMDLPEKSKEEVRKILNSKQLFYEQMCSYHNVNRLNLPHDFDLQRSLHIALRSKDDHDLNESQQPHRIDNFHEEYQADDDEDYVMDGGALDVDAGQEFDFLGPSVKKSKYGRDCEVFFPNSATFSDCKNMIPSEGQNNYKNAKFMHEGNRIEMSEYRWTLFRSLHLEEKRLWIQAQMLELENERFKWQKFSKNQERQLDKMKQQNEFIRLENDRMAMDIKHNQINRSNR